MSDSNAKVKIKNGQLKANLNQWPDGSLYQSMTSEVSSTEFTTVLFKI
jgi:hypothetical protein